MSSSGGLGLWSVKLDCLISLRRFLGIALNLQYDLLKYKSDHISLLIKILSACSSQLELNLNLYCNPQDPA